MNDERLQEARKALGEENYARLLFEAGRLRERGIVNPDKIAAALVEAFKPYQPPTPTKVATLLGEPIHVIMER